MNDEPGYQMTMFERLHHFIRETLIHLSIIAVGLAIFVGMPAVIYVLRTYTPSTPSKTFSLRVDDWECTQSYQRDTEVCSKGSYWRHETICTQWSKK